MARAPGLSRDWGACKRQAAPATARRKPVEADMSELSDDQKRDFEAAAFRRLVEHLRERGDVQNIDLMNLAGFCRNCLANWYQEAASTKGLELTKEGARE